VFEPSRSIEACTAACEPVPTAINVITDATPITIPKIVSAARILFATIPPHAKRKVCFTCTPEPPAANPIL
jgi:hypothetical protein